MLIKERTIWTPDNSFLLEYKSRIEEGEIIVGNELFTELENLEEDLKDEEYFYDVEKARIRMDFMENCIRLTKSPYYNKPMVLMLWQKAFIEALYSFKMAREWVETKKDIDRFKRALLLIARKNTKALDLDTRVPTPDGDRTIRDIQPGDFVFNELWEPIKVLGVSEIFKNRKCYEIEFEDGEKIVCDENHKWTVQTDESNSKYPVDDYGCITVQTYEMVDDFKREGKDGKGAKYKYRVPTPKHSKEVTEKYKSIVNIKEVASRNTKCIKVDNERGLFLCGERNTVTHNSELCSALGNAEFITGNEGSDLVCSSNDDAQASIVYDAMDTMRQLYDPEDLDTKRNQRFILNKITNTKVFKLSDRTRNKEGRNIDWAILDEAHEMKDNVIAKSIEQSQSLKENPKFIIITTEGFVDDGFLDEELKKGRAIIKGEDDSISSKRFLPWFYTQDSEQEVFTNPRSWMKSNPTLGTIKRYDYLEEQVDIARRSKADRIFVLSKDFNFKQNSVEAWLNLEDYSYECKFDVEDLRGCKCIGHVDLAETTDLCCAKALIVKGDSNVKYILTQYFIPESKLDEESDDHNAGAKYKEWADKGLITICEGNDLDLTVVADWFFHLHTDFGIDLYKCGYDQRFARDWLKGMETYGWTKEFGDVEMVLQNAQTLNNALRLVERDLKARLIFYNENEVDKWCFKNSCLKVNDQRQALCVKTKNENKIDGTVTLISLYEMYRRYRADLKKMNGGA